MLIDKSKLSVEFTLQGKTHNVEDLPATEQLWHKLISVKDGVYTVECKDRNWNVWVVPFTKGGYDRHIKDLQPSLVSPFSVVDGDLK